MKKIFAWSMIFVMVLGIVGCTSAPTPTAAPVATTAPEPTTQITEAVALPTVEVIPQYPDFKIAALLSGVITDNGWSANLYQAISHLHDKYGIEFSYVESVAVSDMEEFLRGYATQGYNLVIAHGSQYIDVVNSVAPDFPNTIFAISYANANAAKFDNVICVGPYNGGALMGIVAGALTTSNKVAILGSTENPSITAELEAFKFGVHLVNPNAEAITGYIGDATDAGKGKEMALSLITNQGVDVIGHFANAAGLGVLQAASEAKVYAIGINTDQYAAAPDAVVVSVLRNFSAVYEEVFLSIVNGTFQGNRLISYGIGQQGVTLSDWHGWDTKLPADKLKLIQDTIQGIIDGTIAEK